MSNYYLEDKEAFTVAGIGVELTANYTDFAEIQKQKSEFWETVNQNGTVKDLLGKSDNGYLFVVNEAYDNKMMHYVGVETDQEVANATRLIEFPAGKYVIVESQAEEAEALNDYLTNTTFGEVLGQISDYAYVGGPNAAVQMALKDGKYVGQMWIPVVAQ